MFQWFVIGKELAIATAATTILLFIACASRCIHFFIKVEGDDLLKT